MGIKEDVDEYNKGSLYGEIQIDNILNEYMSSLPKKDLINKLSENQQNTLLKLSSKIILDKSWEAGFNNSFKNIIYSIENDKEFK